MSDAAPPLTIRDRLERLRTRILSSPRFREWSASFPLTRPIARMRARKLFDISAGFVYSQVLLACARLGIFEALADGPRTPAEVAAAVDLDARGMERLVTAAIPLDLLRRTPSGRIALGPLGAPMANNAPLKAMLEHNALLYEDLLHPEALLRGELAETRLGGYWPYAHTEAPGSLPDDQVEAYSRLMTASNPLVAREVIEAYDFSDHRHVMDVGGGEGGFLLDLAEEYDHLDLTVFDLPSVAGMARKTLSRNGRKGADRIRPVGGDFFAEPLPTGADVITLLRVLLDHPDERAARILRAVHEALPPGGTVVIAEATTDGPGAAMVGATFFNLYLLALGSGRARTSDELKTMLRDAGFTAIRTPGSRLPVQTSILTARK